jgi:hypothetical protein
MDVHGLPWSHLVLPFNPLQCLSAMQRLLALCIDTSKDMVLHFVSVEFHSVLCSAHFMHQPAKKYRIKHETTLRNPLQWFEQRLNQDVKKHSRIKHAKKIKPRN